MVYVMTSRGAKELTFARRMVIDCAETLNAHARHDSTIQNGTNRNRFKMRPSLQPSTCEPSSSTGNAKWQCIRWRRESRAGLTSTEKFELCTSAPTTSAKAKAARQATAASAAPRQGRCSASQPGEETPYAEAFWYDGPSVSRDAYRRWSLEKPGYSDMCGASSGVLAR